VQQPPAAQEPVTVTVIFEGAVIGLGKVDHDPWDFDLGGAVPEAAWTELAKALTNSNPYGAVLGLFAQPLLQPVAKPDPYGMVTVEGQGVRSESQWLAELGYEMKDTFRPAFPQRPRWTGVPLDRDIRFTVQLLDEDLLEHDNIGTATINMDDVKAALAAKQVFHVNVAGQTDNQLLFFDISVLPE
jgi:hypothetical protein